MELLWVLGFAAVLSLAHGRSWSTVDEGFREILRERSKRDTEKEGFTQTEKQTVLDKHNEFRRVPNAADMLLMFWDNELEGIAQGWASMCNFEHNSARTTANDGRPGENLYVTSGGLTVGNSVTSWNAEVADYTYSSNTCADTKVCGHYTQVVWAGSYKVGCGIKYCSNIQNSDISSGYLVVCNYIVHGNVVDQKPYTEGTACTQCPAGKTTCVSGLCSDGSSVTIPPAATTTESATPTTTASAAEVAHVATTTLIVSLLTYLLAF